MYLKINIPDKRLIPLDRLTYIVLSNWICTKMLYPFDVRVKQWLRFVDQYSK